jgi:Fe-S-cluster containining protein
MLQIMKAPFKPTSCSCREDRSNCTRQPGHLLPGQLAEIMAALGKTVAEAGEYLWNSPGMVVGNAATGERWRIRTITPRFENGRCVFYTADGRCSIHKAAPFGCRYFDMHMRKSKAQTRASWGVRQILDHMEQYRAERDRLPEATHYAPKEF